ncbi:MltA-interacting protein [Xanthomonas arboricola pv. juglandis]|uniref:MipA/OmpV family protein n=1 Tax=Xanthomonas TaxID=338 RepID=UPI000E943106|nr:MULTISPECIES: MipA/OmpV family protein [Xanthomonas]SYZ51362.1 MltA-interacting protein [Xanthomonas arboricola pv. juglandis]
MSHHQFSRRQHALWTRSFIAATALATAWVPSALAQDTREGARWSAGIGAVVLDQPYRDFDREIFPLPIISYESKWISATVPVLDFKFFSTDNLSLRARVRLSGDGYNADDSPFMTGMDDRSRSLWAGGALIWKTELANLSAEVLADTMGNSKGARAKVQIDRRFSAGKFGLTPRLAAEWVDDKFVDYYYGVRQSEALAGRPFYEGTATTNIQFGLRMDYLPSRHHAMFIDLGATRVGSTIEDSPLVDKTTSTTIALGYAYRF